MEKTELSKYLILKKSESLLFLLCLSVFLCPQLMCKNLLSLEKIFSSFTLTFFELQLLNDYCFYI